MSGGAQADTATNGSASLVRTLVQGGVGICFANPGTSEMHFVSSLDRIDGIRCVLALFEGVATGAADGFYRMSGKPACTLLHLGPGLANGLANLHNARKARSGIVNIVGEHANYHIALDAPLTSDIQGLARPMSDWVKTSLSSETVAADGAEAVAQARSGAGRVATLILPANTAWGPGGPTAPVQSPQARTPVDAQVVKAAARALSAGGPNLLFMGGAALRGESLLLAGKIAAKTGCRLCAENLNARLERGAGRVPMPRLPYSVKAALAQLADVRRVVLVGAKAPVAFFAYPDMPSVLTPEGCDISTLCDVNGDIEAALRSLAEELGAQNVAPALMPGGGVTASSITGAISAAGIGEVLGQQLPEGAIVVDESITTGRLFGAGTDQAAPHDWLGSMGGSIGFGMPIALGAALAKPGQRVLALEGDGSAMYTPQSLWSMAREGAKVTVVIFANRSYEILKGELANVGAGMPGKRANEMLTLDRPVLSWTLMARSMGVESGQAVNLEELAAQLQRGLRCDGPYLIEVVF